MNNNTIVSTMKIHNHLIVSTIQILNKNSLKKNSSNNSNHDYSQDEYEDYYYDDYDDYENCDNCDRSFLNTLLYNGLCEMCSTKKERKLKIFRRKMKGNN